MDEIKDQIAQLVQDMRFERRKNTASETKMMIAALKERIEAPMAALSKLHLRLWHAAEKGDYRSLPPDEAKRLLTQVSDEISAILKDSF